VEVEDLQTAGPPAYAPASDVEMGWSVKGSGVSRERPRFQVAVAHFNKDAAWKGKLRCRVTDYFGAEIQDETFPLELQPADRILRTVEVGTDRTGYFRVDLALTDGQGNALASDTLSLVRAREGRGGDAVAICASQSENSHVNQMAVLSRLGFRQTRLYNVVNWTTMEPEEGVKAPIRPYMARLMGDSGMVTQVNLYVGKPPVKFNIPKAEAVACLVDLIREHGRWTDPATEKSSARKSVAKTILRN
jgi:hypothetical protein